MTATVFHELADSRPGEQRASWMPARYTRELRPGQLVTDGDRLLSFAGRHFTTADAGRVELDDWQRWLLRRLLERYPDDWPVERLRGQLRYRRVVVSMGRQNGKSLLGALLVLYLLCMHARGPRVIGLASIDKQAKIVYDRVKYAVDSDAALSAEIRTTDTRGITRRDRTGVYETLPAKEDSAQGHPASGVLYDELHLGLQALWDAMVLAMRARRHALLIGFTTAGDDDSQLLLNLYEQGDAAVAGTGDERFGFFVWEAEDDQLTEAGVLAANPAVACGRIPLDEVMADAVTMWNDERVGPDGMTGRQRVVRYTLNRFVEGAAGSWAPLELWKTAPRIDRQSKVVSPTTFAITRTPGWEWASVVAATAGDDKPATQLVASIQEPTPALLRELADQLLQLDPQAVVVVAGRELRDLGKSLKDAGRDNVWILSAGEEADASQGLLGTLRRGDLAHADDELLRLQYAAGRRRNTEEGWRLSQSSSAGDIDALRATAYAVHVARNRPDAGVQLF